MELNVTPTGKTDLMHCQTLFAILHAATSSWLAPLGRPRVRLARRRAAGTGLIRAARTAAVTAGATGPTRRSATPASENEGRHGGQRQQGSRLGHVHQLHGVPGFFVPHSGHQEAA